ncbi:hypothetical protein QM321_22275, partial [Citrobacter koseri]
QNALELHLPQFHKQRNLKEMKFGGIQLLNRALYYFANNFAQLNIEQLRVFARLQMDLNKAHAM